MPPPHLRHRMSNIERQMDTYGRGRAGDTPIQSGGGAGEFGGRPGWMNFTPPQQERLYTERNPFTTPYQGFSDQGEPRRTGYMGPGPHAGIMGLPRGEASDTYNALIGGLNRNRDIGPAGGPIPGGMDQHSTGLWQDIKRILKKTKNPGPLIDQWTDHWNEQQTSYNVGDTYPDEMLMAELRPEQIEHMQASDPSKTFLTRQELFQQIKDMEDKGAAGWFGTDIGARDPQEPTTWDEFNEEYKWLEGGGSPYGSEPHTKSYWIT